MAGPRWRWTASLRVPSELALVYLLNELDASVDVLAFDRERSVLGSSGQASVSALPAGFYAGVPWAADLHITPDGRFLYASERRSSSIASFAVDAASGSLTPIGTLATEAEPRGFAIDPSGRWLIASGQESHAIAVYAIDPSGGALAPRERYAVGKNPNWIEIVELP